MKIRIEIECNNSAFQPLPLMEVQRILAEALNQRNCGELTVKTDIVLHDINGNKVGFIRGYQERAGH